MHEDNDACTAMGNAQKPTTQMRHMDIKYFLLCDWLEWDLMHLERVDTKINMVDMFTKRLPRLLFYHHADYLLGQNVKTLLNKLPVSIDYGQTIFCLSFLSRDRATAPG